MSTEPKPPAEGELSQQAGDEQQTPETQAASRQLAGMFGRFLLSMSKLGRSDDEPEDEPSTTELSGGAETPEKPATKPAETPTELSDDSTNETRETSPEGSTELDAGDSPETPAKKGPPGQVFIERFGLEPGAIYFAQGLSMEEAMVEQNKALNKKVDELSARIDGANLGSEEALSFTGEGSKPSGKQKADSGDSALDAFCANTKLPGQS